MNNIFTLNWKNVIGAFVSSALVAMLAYIVQNPNTIAFLVKHPLLSAGVLAGAGSLLKAFLTTSKGNFVGAVPVK